jgi:hypothetical protein
MKYSSDSVIWTLNETDTSTLLLNLGRVRCSIRKLVTCVINQILSERLVDETPGTQESDVKRIMILIGKVGGKIPFEKAV